MRRKGRKPDKPYKAWIASLPCCICLNEFRGHLSFERNMRAIEERVLLRHQTTPTQVAHVGIRGLGQKCSDRETIPLCEQHHAHGYPESHHTLGKRFWEFHGIDRDELIARLQAAYELKNCVASYGRGI